MLAFDLLSADIAAALHDVGGHHLVLYVVDYEQPKLLLRSALERAPGHARLSALFEQVARRTRYSEPNDSFMAARAHIRARQFERAQWLYAKIAFGRSV